MDQVHVIRHKVLVEGLSVRRVAREMGVSRNTVRRYLGRPAPLYSSASPRGRPVRDAVTPRIEALLTESPRWTGGKQKLTATRLHEMLVEEGLRVGVTVVKEVVAEWKRRRREVYVPLCYHPGELGEVDFFEVLVDVDGARRKAWMFLMRLMYSGRDFAHIYDRQDQVSFLDGHVRAFAHFGGVPQRIAYDNLKPAVTKILVGSDRVLTQRFEAMASHYLFEPCFCRPGTGHDKGGVEARGKGIRWRHLVPIPTGSDLAEINRTLLGRLDKRLVDVRNAEGKTIGERFAEEKGSLLPLGEPFKAAKIMIAGASRRSLIPVEGAVYSVPCQWAGLDVTVHIDAEEVEIYGPSEPHSIKHPRVGFGQRSIDYRHYIPELAHKPQAVRQVIGELLRDLGEPFPSTWRLLVDTHGPRQASRLFAKILGYVETRGLVAVAASLRGAIGRTEPILLALAPAADNATVSHEVMPASLRMIVVEGGCASDYDSWLKEGAT